MSGNNVKLIQLLDEIALDAPFNNELRHKLLFLFITKTRGTGPTIFYEMHTYINKLGVAKWN